MQKKCNVWLSGILSTDEVEGKSDNHSIKEETKNTV